MTSPDPLTGQPPDSPGPWADLALALIIVVTLVVMALAAPAQFG